MAAMQRGQRMPRKRKAATKAAATTEAPAPAKETQFAPLESTSGTELSEKERAEQTTFKPLTKDGE